MTRNIVVLAGILLLPYRTEAQQDITVQHATSDDGCGYWQLPRLGKKGVDAVREYYASGKPKTLNYLAYDSTGTQRKRNAGIFLFEDDRSACRYNVPVKDPSDAEHIVISMAFKTEHLEYEWYQSGGIKTTYKLLNDKDTIRMMQINLDNAGDTLSTRQFKIKEDTSFQRVRSVLWQPDGDSRYNNLYDKVYSIRKYRVGVLLSEAFYDKNGEKKGEVIYKKE